MDPKIKGRYTNPEIVPNISLRVLYVRSWSRGACYRRNANQSIDLHEAAWTGDTDGVRTCLQQGTFDKQNSQGWTALHLAAWNGHEDVMNILLSVTTEHMMTEGPAGITPAQLASWNVLLLLPAYTPVQHPNFTELRGKIGHQLEKELQPVQIAAEEGNVEFLEALSKAGADLDRQSWFDKKFQDTIGAVHIAAARGHIEALGVLNRSGTDMSRRTSNFWTTMHYAAKMGQAEVIKYLAEFCDIGTAARNHRGQTPIHVASGNGHWRCVKALYDLGADVNSSQNSNNIAPIHEAAISGNTETIITLMRLGARLDARDKFGRYPVHWAARKGDFDALETLQQLGAKLDVLDSEGLSVRDWAGLGVEECARRKPGPRLSKAVALAKYERIVEIISGHTAPFATEINEAEEQDENREDWMSEFIDDEELRLISEDHYTAGSEEIDNDDGDGEELWPIREDHYWEKDDGMDDHWMSDFMDSEVFRLLVEDQYRDINDENDGDDDDGMSRSVDDEELRPMR